MGILFRSRMYIQTPYNGRTYQQIDQWYRQELCNLERFYANERLRLDLHYHNLKAAIYAVMMVFGFFSMMDALHEPGYDFWTRTIFLLVWTILFIDRANRINRSPEPF